MSNYLDIPFYYFPANIETKKPLGKVKLFDYLKAIKNPQPHIVELFKGIEKASLEGNKKLKDELKSKLYYFLPCVELDGLGRSYENITGFSGLMIADMDNLEHEFAKELKEHLFYNYPFVIASFLSASKKGVKVIIKIPKVSSINQFKSLFYGLMSEWQYYKGMDFTPKNAVLANYLTYDAELLYRLDATEWTKEGVQLDEFQEFTGELEPLEEVDEKDVEKIKLILKRMFANITDAGHQTVRSCGLLGGGWIAYGYMSYDDMQEYLFELIDSTPYLLSKTKTYKTTCVQMINKGMTAPLKVREDEE
jgi:hypothetical protein